METTPETQALFAELFARCSVVQELDGPQIEAFVSGLMPVFDDGVATVLGFIDYCAAQEGSTAALICGALGELMRGESNDGVVAAEAVVSAVAKGPGLASAQSQIGASELTGAWTVTAPFGRSVMLGFDNRAARESAAAAVGSAQDDRDAGERPDEEVIDARHSILVELDGDGFLADLQLSGAAEMMADDAGSVDGRVVISPLDPEEALALVVQAWPAADVAVQSHGPGVVANQYFVRHRVWQSTGTMLPMIALVEQTVDVQRGLDDGEFAEANRAALSTLQAALGDLSHMAAPGDTTPSGEAWIGVVRGDGGELSGRERDALLWLEWADWLGAGIGLARAGEAAAVSGSALVDYVNRCPEVSSVIDKADRDYAEWAFAVAIDVLEDAGAVAGGQLTAAGRAGLLPALVQAWGTTA